MKKPACTGVSVLVKGTGGAATYSAGSFVISVPADATTLIIRSVNFLTQEVAIRNDITVSLKPNANVLNDVVVVSIRTSCKKEYLSISYADYRRIAPITGPKIQANPNIASEQNPGY